MTRERPLVILICLGMLSMPLCYHECIYYRFMTFFPTPTTNLTNGSHVRNFLPHALAFTIIKNIVYLCFTAQWAFVDCYWQCFTPPMCGLVLEPGDSAGHCAFAIWGVLWEAVRGREGWRHWLFFIDAESSPYTLRLLRAPPCSPVMAWRVLK